jgi:hypothetical protein
MNEATNLPLTDGTAAVVTAYALEVLEEEFGIVRGRVKKGSAGDVVMVSPKRYAGKPVRGAKEVPLRDLLALHVHVTHSIWDEKDLAGFKLADGDARNLMPSNIVKVMKPAQEVSERKPYTRKSTAVTQRPAESLSIAEQEALFPEVFGKMCGIAKAILTPDHYSKTGSESQADDVVQNVAVTVLSLVRAGKCRAINRGQFFAFCFSLTQRAASWKLQAITNGFCRDVDHDEAEILLLRVKRLEADLRERKGQYAEEDSNSPLEGIDPVWLAKQLEKDAEEKSRRERQRVHEEGGLWERIDLEAGTEIPEELLSEPETEELQEAA